MAEGLRGNGKREALMAEYRRLASEGLIEFVTFHQSMSYEEFVEGLRPSTGDDAGEGPEEVELSTGFRLKPHDGVFKRVSERAERDPGEGGTANRLNRSRRIIRLGLTGPNWKEKLGRAVKDGNVEWPHGGEIDWSAPEYESWEAIKAKRQQDEPNIIGNHPTVYGTWLFRGAAETGEYAALTVGKNRIVALARFDGDYSFEPAADGRPARHLRPVDWIWHDSEGVDRSGIYGTDFTSFHTAYPLLEDQLNWDALDRVVFGADVAPQREVARPFVLIIDEINRANISKVFGELITLLEPDKRLGMANEIRLMLPYSKKPFGVPANLHIIGTMNTADRSIALLDTALRRRFTFHELMPDPSVLPVDVDGINLQRLLTTINDRIEYLFDREHQIGHAYFTGCETRDCVDEVMRHKVIPLLAEYFYEDWSKVAAVLGDTGQGPGRFLEARRLAAPAGVAEADFVGEKLRWRVKNQFDFSEFEA
ncbi:McrB family protein [Sinorhizobium meliloti]